MSNETARQAYIRLLRDQAARIDSLNPQQRDVVLRSELIDDGCLDGSVHPNSNGFPVGATTQGIKPKGRLLLQQLEKEEMEAQLIKKHRDEFQSVEHSKLAAMRDEALAAWQGNFRQDEPEWRIAEYEWQRRITAKQIRAGRWNAGLALAGVVVGALLTSLLSSHPPFGKSDGSTSLQAQSPTDIKTNNQRQTSGPARPPPAPLLAPTGQGQTNGRVHSTLSTTSVPPTLRGHTNSQPNP